MSNPSNVAEPVEPTKLAPARVKSGSPLRIKAPDLVKEAGKAKRRYWIGTTKDCRIQNVYAGGQCFPRFTGTPDFDKDGNPDRPLQHGAEVDLDEDELERCLHGIRNRVVRRFDERWQLKVTDGKGFRPTPNDEPLGRYVYIVPIPHAGFRPEGDPAPLME